MKISNLFSPKGNAVINQYKIEDNNIIYFQSYDTMICKVEGNKITLNVKYYSRTTSKYLNIFLNEFNVILEKKMDINQIYTINNFTY